MGTKKRRVEIEELDGHRRIYEDSDQEEWRRRTVDYVSNRVLNKEAVSQSVLWMIGRREHEMANETPVRKLNDPDVREEFSILEFVDADHRTLIVLGPPKRVTAELTTNEDS
jgi:hypothetical protein